MKETDKKEGPIVELYRYLCRWEPYICVVILATTLCYALWPILCAPVSHYPSTIDGMGHMTKIKYIADCFKELEWPSWFPYWYNGSTVMQYYPPLSYLLLAPIQMIFDNIMITFKFYGFFTLFIGALGAWCICYRWVGSLVGIWAGILYALQPYLMRSLFLAGTVAQSPIYALTPWFLFITLLLVERKTPMRWLALVILTWLLILSHAMHAFLIVLGLVPLVITLVVLGRIKWIDFLCWGLAIAFGAGMASFWWMIGVTPFETPGVPYLLSEAAEGYTANLNWFNPVYRNTGSFYFGISMLSFALLSALWIRIPRLNSYESINNPYKGTNNQQDKLFMSILVSLIFSIILSFGYHIPLFNYIPMSNNLVPGRLLSFSGLLAAILCAVFVKKTVQNWDMGYWRIVAWMVISISAITILIDINPRVILSTNTDTCNEIKNNLNLIPSQEQAYMNGRFTWLLPVVSNMTYFPMVKGLYMADGWNIEGTPHNRFIWQHNIAIPAHCNDYVVRNLFAWNVRSLFIADRYDEVQRGLKNQGFQTLNQTAGMSVLYNPAPSSYFMRQERDAIAIGLAAPGLVMNFPWMVQGKSVSLEDYDSEYLQRFNLIYLIEPDVKDFKQFQNMISELAGQGKTVIVSMGRFKTWPLGDIIPYWENIGSGAVLVPTPGSPFTQGVTLEPDPFGQAPAMGNLDGVWMEMQVDKKRVPAIGYKNIGGNRVYYVGLSMGQQLNSTHGVEIKALLEQLMDMGHPNKNFIPAAIPVSDAQWGYDGFSFKYKSEQPVSMLVSVTYTPRWQGKLDSSPLKVQQLENLILLDLPAGEHQVSMHYGMTWVGWLGIALSIFSLLIVIFIYRRFDDLDRFFAFITRQIRRVVEGLGA